MARLGCGCGDPVDHRDLVDLALVPVNEERAGEFKELRYLRIPLAVRPAWWLLWHGLFFTNAIDSRAHLVATSFESGNIPAIFVPQKEWILRLLTRQRKRNGATSKRQVIQRAHLSIGYARWS